MSIESDLDSIGMNIKDSFFSGKSILITGGAGFLGSWLCDLFLRLGSTVMCLDDLSTGDAENISNMKSKPNFVFLKSSVDNKFEPMHHCDIILHLASRPSPDDYVKFPVETLSANSKGTNNILDIARKHDSLVLFASSSEVYGNPTVVPTPESYCGNVNPVGIRSCYDEGKRFSEALLMAYNREYGLDSRIVRIFNTYGPRMRADGSYGRALPRFIYQALTNQNITIHGDGLQTRSFCYVTDTIRGIIACLSSKTTAIPINIGNSKEITILDLAKLILSKINSKSQLDFIERPNDDPQRRCPDISLAYKALNWKPEIDLERGIEKSIKWFKNSLQ